LKNVNYKIQEDYWKFTVDRTIFLDTDAEKLKERFFKILIEIILITYINIIIFLEIYNNKPWLLKSENPIMENKTKKKTESNTSKSKE